MDGDGWWSSLVYPYRIFKEKKKLKTMSKGGHTQIYIGFCQVVVRFLGGDGFILFSGGWWGMVVGGGIVQFSSIIFKFCQRKFAPPLTPTQ